MGKTAKVAKSGGGSEAELKALTHSVLKKIKEKQLEVLLQAVESKGGARSPCLLLPGKVDAKVGQQSYSLPMLLYKVFRWPDLRHSSELKRLSCCESYGKSNPELVCCNPHHMSRLCELGKQRYSPCRLKTSVEVKGRASGFLVYLVFCFCFLLFLSACVKESPAVLKGQFT